MQSELRGATIWARQTIYSEIFFYKPDKWFKIWFFVVNAVNHKDTKLFKRGEGLITYEEIMAQTRASKKQVEKCIKFLEKGDMISSRKTTRGMIRFVLNYAIYQDLSKYKGESKGTHEGSERGVGGESEGVPITKECKNDKNVNNTPYNPPRDKKKVKKYTKQDSQNPVWERLCDQLEELNLTNHVNPSLYLSTVTEYSARGAVGPEVRACLFWCKDKGFKMVTVSRIRNWLKNWAEKMKQKEVQQLAYYQDKKFEQQVKSSEFIKPKLPPVWTPPS